MRISEVSKRSGISATALRYYESIGLLAPARALNGYRDYSPDVLNRLDLIEASKELGSPLDQIGSHLSAMESTSCTDVREELRPLSAEQVRQIQEKQARLDRLRSRLARAEHDLDDCPDRSERCSTECVFRTSA